MNSNKVLDAKLMTGTSLLLPKTKDTQQGEK